MLKNFSSTAEKRKTFRKFTIPLNLSQNVKANDEDNGQSLQFTERYRSTTTFRFEN